MVEGELEQRKATVTYSGMRQSAALAWLQDWGNTYGSSLTFYFGPVGTQHVCHRARAARQRHAPRSGSEAHASTQGCSAALGASPPDIP
jgi:hypothetical protein